MSISKAFTDCAVNRNTDGFWAKCVRLSDKECWPRWTTQQLPRLSLGNWSCATCWWNHSEGATCSLQGVMTASQKQWRNSEHINTTMWIQTSVLGLFHNRWCQNKTKEASCFWDASSVWDEWEWLPSMKHDVVRPGFTTCHQTWNISLWSEITCPLLVVRSSRQHPQQGKWWAAVFWIVKRVVENGMFLRSNMYVITLQTPTVSLTRADIARYPSVVW